MAMQQLKNDNPPTERHTLGSNLAKINANFTEVDLRLQTVEARPTGYQVPASGIPETILAASIRASLGRAASAVLSINGVVPGPDGNVVMATSSGPIAASQISDATLAGRSLLTAADPAAQRAALVLGTAATAAASSFATAGQGAKADTALQVAAADARYATIAQGGKADTALQQAAADARYATLAQGAKADTALQQAAADARYVRTVGGVAPDANGNVPASGGSGGGTTFAVNATTGFAEATIGGQTYAALPASFISQLNLPPLVVADTGALTDATGTLSGNVLTNDSDPNNDAFTVSLISYGAAAKTLGASFATAYGSMVMNTNGSWTYTVGAAGHALNAGSQPVAEVFTYTALDARGGVSKSTTLTITLTGTNEAPVAASDAGAVPPNATATGSVLANDSDPEGATLLVTQFTVVGVGTIYSAGQTATVAGVGSMSIAANGTWTFTPANNYMGVFPLVTYTVSDGVNTSTSTLSLSVIKPPPTRAETIAWFKTYRSGQVQPSNIAPNPMVARVAPSFSGSEVFAAWDWKLRLPDRSAANGSNYDFRVGPGKEYTELNQVPWLSLLPGDRVFIYWRATPYSHVIPVHVRGEPTRWIEIIGMRGPNGELPVLDATDAIEDPNVVKLNPYHTGAGMINIMAPLDGRTSGGFKPGYIHIHGLEVCNALPSKKLTDYTGKYRTWGEAAGIRGLGGDFITISGCYIHDCSNGLFINSTEDQNSLNFMKTRYLHSLFNLFRNNSTNGSFGTHNAYTEATCSIHEFNYFDHLAQGSASDLIKERSCGNIFRYNYFRQQYAANCISIRDPESQYLEAGRNFDSLGAQLSSYSFVYSNTFVSTEGNAIVGYGDGNYAQNGQIRRNGQCFFYNNRVVTLMDQRSATAGTGVYYDFGAPPIFAPWNELPTLVVFNAKNNLFYAESATPGAVVGKMAVFAYQGSGQMSSNYAHNLQPTYYSTTITRNDATDWFRGAPFTGTLASLNLSEAVVPPGFNNFAGGDYSLLPSSPFYSLNEADDSFVLARGLSSQGAPINYPFGEEPAPIVFRKPVISGNQAAGSLLTAVDGGFTPYPTTLLLQWLRDGVEIAGQTGQTYQSVSGDANHVITHRQTASNSSGQTIVSTSDPFYVLSATTPQNLTLPQLSGSLQDGFPIDASNGTWTNNPVSFAYKWFLNGAEVVGQTASSYTAPTGSAGKTVECEVKATNSVGEFSAARSAAVTIIPTQLDPDAYGKFNFAAANGTTLKQLSSKWNANLVSGNRPYDYFFCDGNGKLTGSYISANNGGTAWYENGQSDMVSVEIGADVTSPNGGEASIALRCSTTQVGYLFIYYQTSMKVTRNNVDQESHAHTFGNSAIVKVVPGAGGTFAVWVNGSLFFTYTDPTPLTGGYPGLEIGSGSAVMPTPTGITYWTDAP